MWVLHPLNVSFEYIVKIIIRAVLRKTRWLCVIHMNRWTRSCESVSIVVFINYLKLDYLLLMRWLWCDSHGSMDSVRVFVSISSLITWNLITCCLRSCDHVACRCILNMCDVIEQNLIHMKWPSFELVYRFKCYIDLIEYVWTFFEFWWQGITYNKWWCVGWVIN